MKITEEVCSLINKFISKNKSESPVVQICNNISQTLVIFLSLPENKTLLDDNDLIFIQDIYHDEREIKQFLYLLSNVLVMKITDLQTKTLIDSLIGMLSQDEVNLGDINKLNDRIISVLGITKHHEISKVQQTNTNESIETNLQKALSINQKIETLITQSSTTDIMTFKKLRKMVNKQKEILESIVNHYSKNPQTTEKNKTQ